MAITTVSGTTAAAIQSDITSASAGDILMFPATTYSLSTTVNVDKAITLWFTGGQFNVTHNSAAFNITASARIQALNKTTITGPRTGNAYNSSSIAFLVIGASASARVTDVTIEGPFTLNQFLAGGVFGRWLTNFNVRGIAVKDCTYYGIMLASVTNAHIDSNNVDDLHPENTGTGAVGFENAYGISATAASDNSTVSADPVCDRVWITNNRIRGVKTWTAIDTHGGQRIHIVDNDIQECYTGIYVTLALYLDGTLIAPIDCIIRGNRLVGQYRTPDRYSGYGIAANGNGAGSPSAYRISITDNHVTQFGWKGGSGSATNGIGGSNVVGLTINGNQVVDSGHRGIQLAGPNSAAPIFGTVGGNYVQQVTGASDGGAGLDASGPYVACGLEGGTFYSMTYALYAPSSPASGNFGLWTARGVALTHVSSMWASTAGRIDLGATAI